MDRTIYIPDKAKGVDWDDFLEFVQSMAYRVAQGHHRYGLPRKEKRYFTRAGMERKAYRRTGNREHLLNDAVYQWLETQAPENPKFHWDNTVDSVTRGRI